MSTKRHGDLNFKSTKKAMTGKKVEHNGSFVLALGEATGHRHVITCERPQDMIIYALDNGCFMLDLKSSATITHEEHKTITLIPGRYTMGREREYDHFLHAKRQVID